MYHIDQLKKLSKLGQGATESMQSFQALDAVAFAEGKIPVATKELIAVAVAVAKQCPYCIAVHEKKARQAGVTEEELAEAVFVAAAIGAGAAVTHGTHLIDS